MGNERPDVHARAASTAMDGTGARRPEVIPIVRSLIVPANRTLPNISLIPRSVFRHQQAARAGDASTVVHLHEPMTPTPCVATLAMCTGADWVGTFTPNGDPRLDEILLLRMWGFLMEAARHRIAVSDAARSADRWLPSDY